MYKTYKTYVSQFHMQLKCLKVNEVCVLPCELFF